MIKWLNSPFFISLSFENNRVNGYDFWVQTSSLLYLQFKKKIHLLDSIFEGEFGLTSEWEVSEKWFKDKIYNFLST